MLPVRRGHPAPPQQRRPVRLLGPDRRPRDARRPRPPDHVPVEAIRKRTSSGLRRPSSRWRMHTPTATSRRSRYSPRRCPSAPPRRVRARRCAAARVPAPNGRCRHLGATCRGTSSGGSCGGRSPDGCGDGGPNGPLRRTLRLGTTDHGLHPARCHRAGCARSAATSAAAVPGAIAGARRPVRWTGGATRRY